MDNTFLGDKVFEVEGFEVGYIFVFAPCKFLLCEREQAFGGNAEGSVEACVRVTAEDGLCFGSSVADESHGVFIEVRGER